MTTYRLNDDAVQHARKLIDAAQVDTDASWADGKPSADEGNAEIDEHGYAAYGSWFLGIDPDASADTKERYHFPVGDFSKIYRQGLIAAASRAAQNEYDAVAEAATQLLDHLDDTLGIAKG